MSSNAHMNIYVSNLSRETTGDELRQAFTGFGEVTHVVIMGGESTRGSEAGRFGYVEMTVKSEGAAAINRLNGTKIGGRVVNTVEALPLSKIKTRTLSRRPHNRSRWAPKINKTIL